MGTDPAWIQDLLKSNYAPSDKAAEELKRLLLRPLKYLEDLDTQILGLRTRLSELESKRNQTQKQISRYKSILLPIRRVPEDVLAEIFYRCLPTHRNPIIKLSDCPLLLTHICSTWRATAISTQKLWDRLHITFTDEDTLPDVETAAGMAQNGIVLHDWRNAPTKAERERTTEVLRQRYEAVKEWFLRSGTRALSISMNVLASEWCTVPYSERPSSLTMEFLSFLASLAPRWKEFEVKAPFMLYSALEDMLPVSQMVSLTCFKAKYPDMSTQASFQVQTQHIKLFDAPNLRQISLATGYDQVWIKISISHQTLRQWDKLTDISGSSGLSFTETASLFKHAANLVHYQGVIKRDPSQEDTALIYGGPISLPSLQSLCILDASNPKIQVGHTFYDRIEAPKLHSFKYFNTFRFQNSNPTNSDFPILPLIRKSRELQNLSVDAKLMSELNLISLLDAAPSVTNLTIGDDKRLPERDTIIRRAFIDYHHSGSERTYLWSISDLIVKNSSSSENDSNSAVLLPRLESLVVARRDDNLWISDDKLFDLVKSRITSPKTAILRHVKVYLYRERQRDIAKELARYAERLGVHINLEFKYAPTQLECAPDIQTGFTPDFGLRKEDGRFWLDIEAGEFLRRSI